MLYYYYNENVNYNNDDDHDHDLEQNIYKREKTTHLVGWSRN